MSNDLIDLSSLGLSADVFKEFADANKDLSTSSGNSIPRISIKGGRVRKIIDGDQVGKANSDGIQLVIVKSAKVSRSYYEGVYDPEKKAAPACWSSDTQRPDESVPEDQRQSSRCSECPQNVKGSGQGQSRACRFSQRLAVAIADDLSTVYQLSIPSMSIFGDAEGAKMPMAAYARFLKDKGVPAAMVVTEAYFDEDSEVAKLFFRPVRTLTDEEIKEVRPMLNSDAARKCVELTVAQADGVQKIASDVSQPVLEPPAAEPELEVEEPKKAPKKAAPKVEESDEELSDIVDGWDDE